MELSWDAFPEPTPEAENWRPDPGSVPVTGNLPDPRFNKNLLTERQRMGLKRERRFGLAIDSVSEGTRASSPMAHTTGTSTTTNVGSWPAPALRSTGLPRTLAPPTSHLILTPSEAPKVVETPLPTPAMACTSTPKTTTLAKFADSCKGTMETSPAQPPLQRPYTPAASVTSQRSESSDKTSVPAWARSLAHLLGESPPKLTPLSRSLPVQDQHATLPSMSTPPHLRKQRLTAKSGPTKATTLSQRVNVTSQERTANQYTGGPMGRSAKAEVECTQLAEVSTMSCVTSHTLTQPRISNYRRPCWRVSFQRSLPHHPTSTNAIFIASSSASWRTRWICRGAQRVESCTT